MAATSEQCQGTGDLELHISGCHKDLILPGNSPKSPSNRNGMKFDAIFDWSEDEDDFTEEIHRCSSTSSTPSVGAHVLDHLKEEDEWDDLEHEEADPTSCRLGSLAPQLENLSISDSTTSDSSDEASEASPEFEIFYARRVLASRAISPPRRESIYPPRKTIVIKPAASHLRDLPDQCSSCENTIFRLVSDKCSLCAYESTLSELKELDSIQEEYDEVYNRSVRIMSNKKLRLEAKNPEGYEEDTEWLDLRSEYVSLHEEQIEQNAIIKNRQVELEILFDQYNKALREDMDKSEQPGD